MSHFPSRTGLNTKRIYTIMMLKTPQRERDAGGCDMVRWGRAEQEKGARSRAIKEDPTCVHTSKHFPATTSTV